MVKLRNEDNGIASLIKRGSPIFIFVGLFIFMSLSSEYFFKWSNIMNVTRQSAVLGTLAIGQAFVIMSAGIDLSVGSIMAMSGCTIAVGVTQWGVPPILAVLIAISVALTIGLINGLLIIKFKLYDFIATLGVKTAVDGVSLLITNGLPISGLPEELLYIGNGKLPGGIPFAAIAFSIVAIMGIIVLNYTTFGRNVLAIGGNKEASRVSGINVVRTKIVTMMLSGLCCGIGGIIMLGRLNSANALMGSNMELNSIAAVVLGGTSINGGQGSIGGTIIGIMTMGVLQNGLELLSITAFWQKVVLGIVILAVVTLDTFRRDKLLQA